MGRYRLQLAGQSFCMILYTQTSMGMGLFFEITGVDTVLFKQVVQIGPVFTGQGCGTADVATGQFKEAEQVAAFKFVTGLLERFNGFRGIAAVFRGEYMSFGDDILYGHGHGVLDGVFQFPHVAGPIVEHQPLHRCR